MIQQLEKLEQFRFGLHYLWRCSWHYFVRFNRVTRDDFSIANTKHLAFLRSLSFIPLVIIETLLRLLRSNRLFPSLIPAYVLFSRWFVCRNFKRDVLHHALGVVTSTWHVVDTIVTLTDLYARMSLSKFVLSSALTRPSIPMTIYTARAHRGRAHDAFSSARTFRLAIFSRLRPEARYHSSSYIRESGRP